MRLAEGAALAAVMILAGIGIPAMAALSGALGRHLASAPAATAILFAVALLIALATSAATGLPPLARVADAPRHLMLGGACVAFYALSITFVGPRFGIGNAILCVLLGQIVSTAVIDHFGLLQAPVVRLGPQRLAGMVLMATGLLLAIRMPGSGAS